MIKRVKRRIIINKIVKNIVLFIISILIIVAFWYHKLLYHLSYEVILIVGGLVIFLAIKLGLWVGSKGGIFGRPKGMILFQPRDIGLVLYGAKRLLIRPYEDGEVKIGCIYEVKITLGRKMEKNEFEKERSFAKVVVEDAYAVLLKEISDRDATLAGFRSLEDFKENWTALYGKFDPEEVVRMIKFDLMKKE